MIGIRMAAKTPTLPHAMRPAVAVPTIHADDIVGGNGVIGRAFANTLYRPSSAIGIHSSISRLSLISSFSSRHEVLWLAREDHRESSSSGVLLGGIASSQVETTFIPALVAKFRTSSSSE